MNFCVCVVVCVFVEIVLSVCIVVRFFKNDVKLNFFFVVVVNGFVVIGVCV